MWIAYRYSSIFFTFFVNMWNESQGKVGVFATSHGIVREFDSCIRCEPSSWKICTIIIHCAPFTNIFHAWTVLMGSLSDAALKRVASISDNS